MAQGWYTLSIMCCLAGMGSKEVMVTAPLVALLYDRTFLAGSFSGVLRERRTYYLCLTSTWLLLGWLVSHGGGTRGEAAGFGLGMAWWPYTLKQCEAIPHYLKLALWPHPLILDYGDAVVRSLAQVWWRGTGLVALVASAIWALRLKPALGFAGACFFFILAPSSSVVPLITQTMAEHRMYLALAAVIILPVLTAYHHLGHKAVIGCAAVALVFAGLTFIRSSTYHTAVSVWADTVNKQPDNARAHNNLAVELRKDPARVPEALAHYEKALQIRPDYAEAHFNLANELVEIPHRMPEALTHYEQALRIKPNYAAAHNNLARELVKIPGRQPEALAHYEQALRFKPDLASAHNNFASELAGIPGRLPEALAHYEQALRLKPDYAAAHFNLANVLATIPGRAPEAIAHYEQALRIKPDFAAAHLNLANELAQIPGRTTEALTHYEQALQFEPSNPFAHNNLAYTLAGIPDRWQEARAHYQEALRIKPDFVLAHRNLAALLANNGELNEAVKHMEMVLQFDPSDESARSYLSILQGRSKP